MNEVWKIAIFWFSFVIISDWVLRQFYFSRDAILLSRLRIVSFIIELATVGFLFFPWLPKIQGGLSGWQIIFQGDEKMIIFFFLLFISTMSLLTKNHKLLKIGALSNCVATALIFVIMTQILPGTIQLELYDIAPIIVAFLLLINTVVVLLLWNQLQKSEHL